MKKQNHKESKAEVHKKDVLSCSSHLKDLTKSTKKDNNDLEAAK